MKKILVVFLLFSGMIFAANNDIDYKTVNFENPEHTGKKLLKQVVTDISQHQKDIRFEITYEPTELFTDIVNVIEKFSNKNKNCLNMGKLSSFINVIPCVSSFCFGLFFKNRFATFISAPQIVLNTTNYFISFFSEDNSKKLETVISFIHDLVEEDKNIENGKALSGIQIEKLHSEIMEKIKQEYGNLSKKEIACKTIPMINSVISTLLSGIYLNNSRERDLNFIAQVWNLSSSLLSCTIYSIIFCHDILKCNNMPTLERDILKVLEQYQENNTNNI